MTTLALVESPAQLLNVAEWAHAGHRGEGRVALEVAVLLPMDAWSRVQLSRVAELAAVSDLDITRFEVRSGTVSRMRQIAAVRKRVAAAERLVVGDLFSGLVQMLLPSATARELVIVDDGTATTEFVRIVTEGRRLTRWHQQAGGAGRGGRAMTWLTEPALDRTLFTCMEVAPPPGIRIVSNEYGWTRSRFPRPTVRDGADLLGTSLVETGIVGEEHYLRAVAAIVRTRGVDRYLAHRRESRDKLRRIAEATGVRVLRPDLPLELLAAQGPIGHTVLTFPSTVAHTLPIVLGGGGVRVELCEVSEAWFTPDTTAHAVGFLHGMAESAKRRHGLSSMSPGLVGR
ncbi:MULTISPECIES: hypothetical protein [Streptomyces]|jgi:hypothetical protein|uniref:Uncharacterized protein n=2 Tax=Streptomyces TaxID=1883 RepID=A0AA40VG88_9ACTN|nr:MULTISPECIES: hypothetical protein [Streptomyces]MBA8942514.1 hypothetical protein [Streptomyces calvus]MBA8975522.1 hypothetical protein [Streptomyces calvus]MYS31049.1 hypothetical protein [Streptomyces sp. SID7804]GGP68903.1 hypothetical protein GCM10010247_47320 [Streptomyces calvus]